jgi:hypothetical protein
MLGSKSARYTTGQTLRFGLLGGCLTILVSAVVGCVFWFGGELTPGPISTVLCWLLAIFVLSSVAVFLAVMDFETFLEP